MHAGNQEPRIGEKMLRYMLEEQMPRGMLELGAQSRMVDSKVHAGS